MKFSIVIALLATILIQQLWKVEGFTVGRGPGKRERTVSRVLV